MSTMITFRARKLTLLAAVLPLLGACSREQQDWRSAEAADSIAAYGQFLQRHPDSELATQARARLAQLQEDRDWQRAGAADNAQAYREFLTQHPNGKWAQEARIRVENFSLGAPVSNAGPTPETPIPAAIAAVGPTPATVGPTPATSARAATMATAPTVAPPAPLPRAPVGSAPLAPTPVGPARAATPTLARPASGGYAVQLGAFSSEAAASNEWQQLTAHFGAQLRGLTPRFVAANTAAGRLYRLQAGVPDEPRARAVCDSLRKRSQACVPVLPR
jgi:cell division septation protein DedD